MQHGPTAVKPLLRVCCCGRGEQEILVDCCTAGAKQQRRAAGECGQCHVVSVRRKLNTDLLCFVLFLCAPVVTFRYLPEDWANLGIAVHLANIIAAINRRRAISLTDVDSAGGLIINFILSR